MRRGFAHVFTGVEVLAISTPGLIDIRPVSPVLYAVPARPVAELRSLIGMGSVVSVKMTYSARAFEQLVVAKILQICALNMFQHQPGLLAAFGEFVTSRSRDAAWKIAITGQ